MYKKIDKDNKVLKSEEFQKDKYKFSVLVQNLNSEELELYSDCENYVVCRGAKKYPTWIWTKDNFDIDLLKELEEVLELFRLDVDIKCTCKRELYDLLVKDNYEGLGDYYFEMGYLTCSKTVKPREADGYATEATRKDKETLVRFLYEGNHEIKDVAKVTWEQAEENFEKKLEKGNYYVWKNKDDKIVAQADYKVVENGAKVAAVYTDPSERNKGYAANLIYFLTNKALEEGYHVALYTDYEYKPSNKAYKNCGYVDEDVLINFSCSKVKEKKL